MINLRLFSFASLVSQLESNLSKKDEIIAAKDRRIAALEAVRVPAASSTDCNTDVHQYIKESVVSSGASIQNNKTKDAANEVSDESCDAESEGSFGSLGLSFLRHDSSQEEDSDAAEEPPDGRWNVPFDETNEDDLSVPYLAGALKDIGFKSICGDFEDHASFGLVDGLAAMRVSSPIRHGTLPFRSGISPIVQAVRLGLSRTDSHESDKENVDPILKRLSADKCTLAQEFGSPCR